MDNVVIVYDHLEYFSITFGIIYGRLVKFAVIRHIFSVLVCFGMFGPGKIWQPCFEAYLFLIR
jgi:hypothetical protein